MSEHDEKFTPKSEQEIREDVIKDFDLLDNEDNKPFIDKAVKKEVDYQSKQAELHKKLGKAISQKQNYRTKLDELNKLDDEDEDGEQKPDSPNGNPAPKASDDKKYVTQDELQATLHRQRYPNLTDEEYRQVNAIAVASNKSFEETFKDNPMVKAYLETNENRQRISGATNNPSNRVAPRGNEVDTIAKELDSDLPPGFR